MSQLTGDYIAISASYGEVILLPLECAALLPKIRTAATTWVDGSKQIELKDRQLEFFVVTAEQVAVAAATARLLGAQ